MPFRLIEILRIAPNEKGPERIRKDAAQILRKRVKGSHWLGHCRFEKIVRNLKGQRNLLGELKYVIERGKQALNRKMLIVKGWKDILSQECSWS